VVDAVDRTHLDARLVHDVDAGRSDRVGHRTGFLQVASGSLLNAQFTMTHRVGPAPAPAHASGESSAPVRVFGSRSFSISSSERSFFSLRRARIVTRRFTASFTISAAFA